jgi:formate/nitrite transporter
MESRMLKPTELCDAVIGAGCGKVKLTVLQTVVLGIMAGMFIALGGAASGVAAHNIADAGVAKLVTGAVFPVGLIMVIICGAELFTGNNLMIIPLMDGKINVMGMLRNWIIVYIANFIGSVLIAFLVFKAGTFGMNSGKFGGFVIKVASTKANLPFATAFSSAILCNLLVCLAVWGAFSAKDVIGKVAIAWFPIMAFVVAGFEHCVANMYFLTAGLFASTNSTFVQASGVSPDKIVTVSGVINNLIPVTLGNMVGGMILVGIGYYLAYKSNSASAKASSVSRETVKAN